MMRILFVVHQFFPNHHTGTERLTLQLAKQIQRMGNFVSVLTYEPNNLNITGYEEYDDSFIKKEYMVESIPVISFKKVYDDSNWEIIFDKKVETALVDLVGNFDLVHFMHPQRFAGILKICQNLNMPTVLTLTDNWLLCPINFLTINKQLCDGPNEGKQCMVECKYNSDILTRYKEAKSFFESIDSVFTGTTFVAKTFSVNGWNKIINLNPFSVDYSYVQSKKQSDNLIFGFIGSLMWHKGAHVLINAFKKIKNDDIKLKIYGSGAEGDKYQTKIFDLIKSDHRIQYCGTFNYSQLPDVMNELSAIIIPSTYKEIFPLVMQTALAYKIPVIASNIGGMPEVIKDGVNGYLFELGNSDELSLILEKITNNPALIKTLSKNITQPPRVEEEAFLYFIKYKELLNKLGK